MSLSRAGSRRVLALAFTAAVAVPVSAASPADAAAGGNEALQFCRSIAPNFEGNIIGPCTSFFRSHDSNARATIVYVCRTALVPAGFFPTQGACVRTIGSL
jgi:hypothetical protein